MLERFGSNEETLQWPLSDMTVVVLATCTIIKLAGLAHFQTVGSNTLDVLLSPFLPITLINSSVVV